MSITDISWQKISSPNSSLSPDTIMSFLTGVALYKTYGRLKPWVGLEIGLSNFRFSKTQGSAEGYTITLDESSSTGFTYSPKVGIDFDLGEMKLGTWASYQSFSFSTPASVSDGTSAGSGKVNISTTASWLALGARIGITF